MSLIAEGVPAMKHHSHTKVMHGILLTLVNITLPFGIYPDVVLDNHGLMIIAKANETGAKFEFKLEFDEVSTVFWKDI